MKFFKIIKDNIKFIGVATSDDFRCFQRKHNLILSCNEIKAQYLICNGEFYRDYWMKSPSTNNINYSMASIMEIDENVYNMLKESMDNGEDTHFEFCQNEECLEEFENELNPSNQIQSNVEFPTLSLVIESKIKELSNKCKKAITSGVDITFPNKINEHFDLTIEDQLNLSTLRYKLNQGENYLIYHSKGGNFTYYTREEVQLIIETADKHILYHNAYFNSLKHYVNSLTDYIIVSKIEYGQEIPELYKSEVLKSLEK